MVPSRPNILFIISDQHKQDVCGCYGHAQVRTPHLDRLAAGGVRFTQATCPSPLCITSRASILTGLFPHTCRALTNRAFDLPDLPTMGSVFRRAGYVTGAIGKVHVRGETRQRDLGFDDRQMRLYTYNFEDYIRAVGEETVNRYATYRTRLPRYQTSYNPTNSPIDIPEEKMFDHLVVDRCIEFMRKHRGRPFFLWAGMDKPHPDWTAPAEYHATYDPAAMRLPPTVAETRTDMPPAWYVSTRQSYAFDEQELYACIAAYYANVTYMDANVGRLLSALAELDLIERTLVVYTTDHGEMLFEHGMVQKQNFFEGSVRVPLIVRHAGRLPQGQTRQRAASLVDLLPTFCQWADVPAPQGLEGRSLVSDLLGQADDDEDVPTFSEYYEWGFPERMVRTRDWKYVYSHGQPCQLYHLQRDPQEQVNRVDEPACGDMQNKLHDLVMTGWEMPDMSGVPHGGPWNNMTSEQHGRMMEEWAATRRRVAF